VSAPPAVSGAAVGATVPPAGGPAVSISPASTRDLLGAPQASVMNEDALFSMIAEMSEVQTKTAQVAANETHENRRCALAELQEALERQHEAEEGGVLGGLGIGDVAKVATIAVAVAAVAVTGGASLAVAGALLSAGAFAVEKTKCFGDASQWVSLGMSVAGGLGTAWSVAAKGAAAAQALQATESTTETSAAGAASAAGAPCESAAAATAGEAATRAAAEAAAKAATRAFFNVALSVETGTHLLLGGQMIENAVYGHDAYLAQRDATKARYEMARLDRLVDDLIEQLKDARAGRQRGNEELGEIKETEGQTLLIAAGARA
jgi:hypothetical protein